MGIENERKFVLTVPDIQQYMDELRTKHHGVVHEMTQGYLTKHVRFRHVIVGKKESHIFTFKTKIRGDTVEIETPMSVDDFTRLWPLVSNRIIHKIRIKVAHNGSDVWEIDFFSRKPGGDIYLIVAEIELPETVDHPAVIPDFIQTHLLYPVNKNDPRFSNKNLTNVRKVKKLMEKIGRISRTAKNGSNGIRTAV